MHYTNGVVHAKVASQKTEGDAIMTKRTWSYELARNEMKIADTYRCPNCGSHWIKLVVVGEGVIKGLRCARRD